LLRGKLAMLKTDIDTARRPDELAARLDKLNGRERAIPLCSVS